MIELFALQKSLQKIQKSRRDNYSYDNNDNEDSDKLTGAVLIVFIVFFVIWLVLWIWSIKRFLNCRKNKEGIQLIVEFIGAFFFPFVYLIYSYAADNDC
jgi:hypothetical protein